MLVNELLTAWAAESKRMNTELDRHGNLGAHNRRPESLEPYQIEALMLLYQRDEFDALCTGPDRHAKFARWAVERMDEWRPALDRQVARAMFEAVRVAVERLKVTVAA